MLARTPDDFALELAAATVQRPDLGLVFQEAGRFRALNQAAQALLSEEQAEHLETGEFLRRIERPDGSSPESAEDPVPEGSAFRGAHGRSCRVTFVVVPGVGRVWALDPALAPPGRKANLAEALSHEIRSPITALTGMADLLLSSDMRPDQRRLVAKMRELAESVLHTVNDILPQSGPSNEETEEPATFSPQDVVDSVSTSFSLDAAQKGLELTALVSATVPPVLEGDGHRLQRILTNLLSNAVKFTTSGSVSLRMTTRSSGSSRPHLVVQVRDTGVGMSRHEAARIFEPFYRSPDARTRDVPGTGLGLGISRELAESMGGTLTVESEPGKGSTFFLSIPIKVSSRRYPASRASDQRYPHVRGVLATPSSEVFEAAVGTFHGLGAVAVSDGGDAYAAVASVQASSEDTSVVLVLDLALGEDRVAAIVERVGATRWPRPTHVAVLAPHTVCAQPPRSLAGRVTFLSKPLNRRELAALFVGMGNADASSPSTPLGRTRVLLLDAATEDTYVSGLLTAAGAKVTTVHTAEEGAAAYEKGAYDLILTTLTSQEEDGAASFVKAVRAVERSHDRPRAVVVALTADAGAKVLGRWTTCGIDGVVSTPLYLDELVGVMERVAQAGPRVLVVEDSRENRDLLRRMLGKAGYDVITAATGAEGIEAAETCSPDLILLDMDLPDMSGLQVTTAIRKLDAGGDVPIVALSGHAPQSLARDFEAKGGSAYMQKPFKRRELLGLMRSLMSPSGQGQGDQGTSRVGRLLIS